MIGLGYKFPRLSTNTHLSCRALSNVRQATKVLSMNMWHMMTWGHRSIKVSAAEGSKVPLREMRQRRCRRVQHDKASKNDAFALRKGCSNLDTGNKIRDFFQLRAEHFESC